MTIVWRPSQELTAERHHLSSIVTDRAHQSVSYWKWSPSTTTTALDTTMPRESRCDSACAPDRAVEARTNRSSALVDGLHRPFRDDRGQISLTNLAQCGH